MSRFSFKNVEKNAFKFTSSGQFLIQDNTLSQEALEWLIIEMQKEKLIIGTSVLDNQQIISIKDTSSDAMCLANVDKDFEFSENVNQLLLVTKSCDKLAQSCLQFQNLNGFKNCLKNVPMNSISALHGTDNSNITTIMISLISCFGILIILIVILKLRGFQMNFVALRDQSNDKARLSSRSHINSIYSGVLYDMSNRFNTQQSITSSEITTLENEQSDGIY